MKQGTSASWTLPDPRNQSGDLNSTVGSTVRGFATMPFADTTISNASKTSMTTSEEISNETSRL